MKDNNRIAFLAVFMALMALYLSAYFVMSRRGYQQSRAVGFKGFFFVLPHNDVCRHANRACHTVFYPLVQLEMWLGTGEHPGGDPLQGLQ